MTIIISPPNDSWASEYSTLRAKIASVAPAHSQIDHIGSTSVPNLDAKNIIDIQLSVVSLAEVDIDALQKIGYDVSKTAKVDHCPPGMKLEDRELQKLFFKHKERPSHLHVREIGRFNQTYPLLCRDYLRSHPQAAAAYAEIKRQLAKKFPEDEDSYYDVKDPVFDLIMEGAREWQKRQEGK